MTVVSISAQNARLDDAEANTDWGSIGGGAGGALETDFKYQGSNCFARKGATAQRGIFLSDNVDSDLSGAGSFETVMFKFICTTPGLLDLLSVPGMRLEVGSGSTTASPSTNFHFYDVQGSDVYPVDKSWLVLPIDPNIASHRTGTTGTPGLTVVDYYALRFDQTAVSKSPNQALDAVDIGAGLTLTGGDGADPDGVWQDFADHDFGTAANRFGYVREVDGAPNVFLVFGQLVIGTATVAVFLDNTGATLVFPDGLFAAGFSGITVDLQTAATDVDFVDSSFFGKGTKAGEDTRPTLTVTGTLGAFDILNSVLDAFAGIILTVACTITGGKVTNSEKITQAGATLDGIEISGATTADGVAFIESDDLAKIKNCKFTFSDGHAIEITAVGTYTFTGNTFTGYGADGTNDAAIFNDSGGLVTINLAGGGSVPTIRNGAGASTVVNAGSVTILVHVADNTGADLQNCRVLLEASDGTGDFPFDDTVTITRVGSVASVAHTAHGLENGDKIVIRKADQQEYNGVFAITNVTTNAYDYTVSGSPATPATGTIKATGAVLEGLTDVNGDISVSNIFTQPQPVKGFARKSTAAPRFKAFSLAGNTVSDTTGLTINLRLILDE